MFENLPKNVINIGTVVLLIAAIAIAIFSFQDSISTSDRCRNSTSVWNDTSNLCVNSSDTTVTQGGIKAAYNVTENGLSLFDNATGQFGTVGTMIGIGLLLAAVVGAFWLFGRREN